MASEPSSRGRRRSFATPDRRLLDDALSAPDQVEALVEPESPSPRGGKPLLAPAGLVPTGKPPFGRDESQDETSARQLESSGVKRLKTPSRRPVVIVRVRELAVKTAKGCGDDRRAAFASRFALPLPDVGAPARKSNSSGRRPSRSRTGADQPPSGRGPGPRNVHLDGAATCGFRAGGRADCVRRGLGPRDEATRQGQEQGPRGDLVDSRPRPRGRRAGDDARPAAGHERRRERARSPRGRALDASRRRRCAPWISPRRRIAAAPRRRDAFYGSDRAGTRACLPSS